MKQYQETSEIILEHERQTRENSYKGYTLFYIKSIFQDYLPRQLFSQLFSENNTMQPTRLLNNPTK